MTKLSDFPIAQRWPAKHPDRLQLYSLPTPNGVKASIMLEEIGLPYEPHLVDFGKNDQLDAGIPVAQSERQDPGDPRSRRAGRQAARLFESGAILLYLAEKTGKLMPAEPARRYETIQWVHVPDGRRSGRCSASSASSTNSPASDTRTSARCDRYGDESQAAARRARDAARRARNGSWATTTPSPTSRLLGWVRNLIGFYEARELVGFDDFAERRRHGWSAAWRGRRCSAA